jgi:hypothetical protein
MVLRSVAATSTSPIPIFGKWHSKTICRAPAPSLVDFYHNLQRLVGVDTVKLSGPAIANIMDKLRAGFEEGYLRTAPVDSWSLDQAIDAYTAVEKRTSLNKQVFIPHKG